MFRGTGEGRGARVLYVAGSGHCGSTLLDLLLGNHPRIAGLGEVHRLSLNPATRKCACGESLEQCSFWGAVIDEIIEERNIKRGHWPQQFPTTVTRSGEAVGLTDLQLVDALLLLGSSKLLYLASTISNECARHVEAAQNSWLLYDKIAERCEVDVVVDSTKNAARMKLLFLARAADVWVIHLVRDGRAVADSARRRIGIPITEAAADWKRANRNFGLAAATIPSSRRLRIRYEDLCDDTESVLRRVCDFLEIDFSLKMLLLKSGVYHEIPGNPMLFRPHETEIVKDETWRERMDETELRQFADVAGNLNRRYGYK